MKPDSKYKPGPDHKDPIPENLKENPFNVPEGYFERFTERLMERMEEERRHKTAPVLRITQRTLAVAAVLVLFLSIGTYMILKNPDKSESSSSPYFAVTLDDLEEFYGMERFDEYTLVSFYLDNIDEIHSFRQVESSDKLPSDQNISMEDIEKYLMENNELENLLLNL